VEGKLPEGLEARGDVAAYIGRNAWCGEKECPRQGLEERGGLRGIPLKNTITTWGTSSEKKIPEGRLRIRKKLNLSDVKMV